MPTVWVMHCSFSPTMKYHRNNTLHGFQSSRFLKQRGEKTKVGGFIHFQNFCYTELKNDAASRKEEDLALVMLKIVPVPAISGIWEYI